MTNLGNEHTNIIDISNDDDIMDASSRTWVVDPKIQGIAHLADICSFANIIVLSGTFEVHRPLNREVNLGPFSSLLHVAYSEFVEAYCNDPRAHSHIKSFSSLNGREPSWKKIMEHLGFWGHSRNDVFFI